ncbi:hypothetical protein KDL44_06685 [bacterium]|nr:hypothetical protein [bacterium]
MDIFLFNRKLMWAVVPLVFWSILVLFGALDDQEGTGDGVGVRLERRGIRLPGRPLEITEDEQGNLLLKLAVLREEDGYAMNANGKRLENLPEGLSVEYSVEQPKLRGTPPRISLLSGENEPLDFLNGRLHVLITEKFILRMSHLGLQVLPKGPGMDEGQLVREMLERRGRERGNVEGMPDRAPGEGRPGMGRQADPAPERRPMPPRRDRGGSGN